MDEKPTFGRKLQVEVIEDIDGVIVEIKHVPDFGLDEQFLIHSRGGGHQSGFAWQAHHEELRKVADTIYDYLKMRGFENNG